MERHKDSFVLSAAKRSRGLEPWQWRTAACRLPTQRQGRLELRRSRIPPPVRGLSQFRFLWQVQEWSPIETVIFWQMNICKFVFWKKINWPFPVAFVISVKGCLTLKRLLTGRRHRLIPGTDSYFQLYTYICLKIYSKLHFFACINTEVPK